MQSRKVRRARKRRSDNLTIYPLGESRPKKDEYCEKKWRLHVYVRERPKHIWSILETMKGTGRA